MSNTDFDLGSIFSGNSVSDSAVMRDSNGNLQTDANGNLVTKVMRNKAGDVVTDGSGKATDEYIHITCVINKKNQKHRYYF